MYDTVLFDLDGTLTDSGPGIMNAVRHSLDRLDLEVGDEDNLRKFVGPPLEESYQVLYGLSGGQVDRALGYYREYYHGMGGVYENAVYPGVRELLAKLRAAGKRLIISTSKGETGTNKVLEHFALRRYFDFVATANHEDRNTKTEVIRYALKECGITDVSGCVMVGDRENDITAARNVGMDSIGALYGYGSLRELQDAGATYIAETPADIAKYL